MNIHRSFAYKIALFKEQLLFLFTDVIISSCIYIYIYKKLPINTSKQNTIYKMTNGKTHQIFRVLMHKIILENIFSFVEFKMNIWIFINIDIYYLTCIAVTDSIVYLYTPLTSFGERMET